MDKFEYKSTAAAFEEFTKSLVWGDIKYELEQWLAKIHEELEDQDGTLSDKRMYRLGGSAEALRNVLAMPEQVMENITTINEEES